MTFKFWEVLKNASEVNLVQKKVIKILNFAQSFVKCKVSLADDTENEQNQLFTTNKFYLKEKGKVNGLLYI